MKTKYLPAFKAFIFRMALAAVIIGPVSCTEKIDLKLDDSFTRLVVEGAITTDTIAHTVKLSTTSSYFFNQPAPVVSGAMLIIVDNTSGDTIPMYETLTGTYTTIPGIFGKAGHEYTLKIRLQQDIGGHSVYEATSRMTRVNPLDSIGLNFHPDWTKNGIWEVKCYVQEPPTVDYYRFLIYRNNVLLTDTINEWFVIDDKFFNGNYTNGAAVGYLRQGNPSEGLKTGDIVTLEVDNISKEYANFIWEVQTEIRGSNPLFSGPPANVSGNISNGAIGFFAAYATTYKSKVVE